MGDTNRYFLSVTNLTILMLFIFGYTNAKAIDTTNGNSQSETQIKSMLMIKRLTGTAVPGDSPIYLKVTDLLGQGKGKEAARYLTGLAELPLTDPAYNANFYNVVVRDMFARMSTRDELQTAPLNDFSATGICIVRNNKNAQELLNGNYYCKAKAGTMQSNGTTAVSQNIVNDILGSNTHYNQISDLDLQSVLEITPQLVLDNNTQAVASPDSAGVLTSRAFMEAHAIAGTNRRIVEFAFREFMCAPITEWANSNRNEFYIGQDVDRFTNGSLETFNTTCRSCHTALDALRPAFGRVDFINAGNLNFVANTAVRTTGVQQTNGIVNKYARNAAVYPDGYAVTKTQFVNLIDSPTDQSIFGWSSKIQGATMREFGDMLASSKNFSKCMAKQVFQTVCRRPALATEGSAIESLASQFEVSNFNLRDLFENVSIRTECIGN